MECRPAGVHLWECGGMHVRVPQCMQTSTATAALTKHGAVRANRPPPALFSAHRASARASRTLCCVPRCVPLGPHWIVDCNAGAASGLASPPCAPAPTFSFLCPCPACGLSACSSTGGLPTTLYICTCNIFSAEDFLQLIFFLKTPGYREGIKVKFESYALIG